MRLCPMGPDGFQSLISLALSETTDEVADPPLAGNHKDCPGSTWVTCSPSASHGLLGALQGCFQINKVENRPVRRMNTPGTASASPSAFFRNRSRQS